MTRFLKSAVRCAACCAVMMASLGCNRHLHDGRRGDELVVVGLWEIPALDPLGAGSQFLRMEVTDTLVDDGIVPHALSRGMAQRVAFAAASSSGARLLIADEPTKGLDTLNRDRLIKVLKDFCQTTGSLVVITHDVAVARQLGGHTGVMRAGELPELGLTEQILQTPRHEYTRQLLAAEPCSWPQNSIATASGSPILRANPVGKQYGEQTVFENVNVQIQAGERIAMTGPSGCGKTTFGNMLLGLVQPSAGSVKRLSQAAPWQFQKLYQDPIAAFAP